MSVEDTSKELLNLCDQLLFGRTSFDDIRRWLDFNNDNQDLLSKAANYKNELNKTPLSALVRKKPPFNLVERLLQLAPDTVKVPNTIGWLPLHTALNCEASHDTIKMLLQAYPKAAEVQGCNGWLPLHIALCENASIDVIKMLLKAYPQGAEVADKYGCLPLHYACQYPTDYHEDFLARLSLLISAYPEGINVQDIDGKFPSSYLNDVVSNSNHTEPLNLLHNAVKSGLSMHLIKLLVQAFPESCTTIDNDGMVPLHYACTGSSSFFLENVIVLLDAHKDSLHIKDNHGRTPLKLLSNTSSIPDKKGMRPLHYAVARSQTLTEQSLLVLVNAYPGSIGTADMYGMLPFHHACLNQALAVEVLMILLSFYPEAVKCFCESIFLDTCKN
jgi:ankyrin repeat protein